MFNPAELVNETSKLQRFALRLTRNKADADDLVQSTLLRALEKSEQFQGGTDLFKWTARIMFNSFVSQYRRKTKFESQYDPSAYIDSLSIMPNQEEAMDLKIVNAAMGRLSAEHREILVLVCIRGLRYEEAAERLSLPVGTVRSRLSRARSALQRELQLEKEPHLMGNHAELLANPSAVRAAA
jgi:RNA polymerase sigma-70 factor (ECF subfamily)